MKLSVKMVIMSQLSDLHCDLHYIADDQKRLNSQINWIKYLVMTYPNTSEMIDPDEVWESFKTKFPQFF